MSEPSGLKAPAGSPQNRHAGPPPARASIHPVVLPVAACIPSNLGVRFTIVLHDRFVPDGPRHLRRSARHPVGTVIGSCCGGVLIRSPTRCVWRCGTRAANPSRPDAPPAGHVSALAPSTDALAFNAGHLGRAFRTRSTRHPLTTSMGCASKGRACCFAPTKCPSSGSQRTLASATAATSRASSHGESVSPPCSPAAPPIAPPRGAVQDHAGYISDGGVATGSQTQEAERGRLNASGRARHHAAAPPPGPRHV